jgi:hypothetical protein
MNSEFQREDRYIVIKRKDLEKLDYQIELMKQLDRLRATIPPRKYLVIESDWPEYETAYKDIEARMVGGRTQAQQIQALTHTLKTCSEAIKVVTKERNALKDSIDEISAWSQEGSDIFDSMKNFSFLLAFRIGGWWADRPWRTK